ncbi:hypothetical protein D3C78_1460890 [compost metagenome]
MLQPQGIGVQAPARGLRQGAQHRVAALACGVRLQQQVQLAAVEHRLIGRQPRWLLAQVLGTFSALQAGIAVTVEPVGQAVDQALGRHVIAQQAAQLALGTFTVGTEQSVDVEAGVLVAYP